jgi:hypothetical protein
MIEGMRVRAMENTNMTMDDITFCRKKYHKSQSIQNDTTVASAEATVINRDFTWQFPVQKILKTAD